MPPQQKCQRRPQASMVSLAALLAAIMMAPAAVLADVGIVPAASAPSDHGPASTPITGASFTSSFAKVAQGSTLNLTWRPIDARFEPLSIRARAINRTAGNRANSFLVTVVPRLSNTTSFSWPLVPFPLPYMTTGLYEVVILPAVWSLSANPPGSLAVPVLARSSFFSISGQDGSGSGGADTPDPTTASVDASGGSSTSLSAPGQPASAADSSVGELSSTTSTGVHHLTLGLGLSLGLAGALVLASFVFLAHRWQQRRVALAEKLRQKRLGLHQ